MNKCRIIAAIMGYKRSTRAVRAFWMLKKRSLSDLHCDAHLVDGKFHYGNNLMTASAALRHNARLVNFNRRQDYFMRRRPFALGAIY